MIWKDQLVTSDILKNTVNSILPKQLKKPKINRILTLDREN